MARGAIAFVDWVAVWHVPDVFVGVEMFPNVCGTRCNVPVKRNLGREGGLRPQGKNACACNPPQGNWYPWLTPPQGSAKRFVCRAVTGICFVIVENDKLFYNCYKNL